MNTEELYNYIHEYFQYQEGNFFYKKVPNKFSSKCQVGFKAGYIDNKQYGRVTINKKYYALHRLVFLYHKGYLPEIIDHIDRNPSNNKIENLREATKSENQQNTVKRQHNTSNYKGVGWHKQRKKWQAQVKNKGKTVYLGSFNTPEEAYKAYCNYCENNLTVYCLE